MDTTTINTVEEDMLIQIDFGFDFIKFYLYENFSEYFALNLYLIKFIIEYFLTNY